MGHESTTEVVFYELPTDFDIFTNTAESILNLPEKVAAYFIMVLRIYAVDKELGLQMISYLKNGEPLDEKEIRNSLDAPLSAFSYIPLSYLKGAIPENNYTPSNPYTITVRDSGEKQKSKKKKTLYIGCSGDGTYRPITLYKVKKKKSNIKNLLGDPWFIEDYTSLTLPVRPPIGKH